MPIVCLGWGSLIWDPRRLPIQQPWFTDGPLAPVEFSRQSKNGRITLVIDMAAKHIPVLWARMNVTDCEEAMEALRAREEIPGSNWRSRIGCWHPDLVAPISIPSLPQWAKEHDISTVVWTALGPQYMEGEEVHPTKSRPSVDWVLSYLRGLTGEKRKLAEEYFRNAPPQIDTSYRQQVESALGWSHIV